MGFQQVILSKVYFCISLAVSIILQTWTHKPFTPADLVWKKDSDLNAKNATGFIYPIDPMNFPGCQVWRRYWCLSSPPSPRLGLDPKLLTKILNMSSGRCWSSDTYNPVPGVLEGVPSANNYQGGFGTTLMAKVQPASCHLHHHLWPFIRVVTITTNYFHHWIISIFLHNYHFFSLVFSL